MFCGFNPFNVFVGNFILDVPQGSEYTSDVNTTRQIQYKVFKGKIRKLRIQYKLFKGKIRTLQKKAEKKWIWWNNYRNIWVKNLSSIYFWQGTETAARNIIMNETSAQVFSSEFCEVFKSTLLIERWKFLLVTSYQLLVTNYQLLVTSY